MGGKYVEVSGVESYSDSFIFSADASEMYCVENGEADKETAYKLQSGSTATSATYNASVSGGGTFTIVFKNLADDKGDIEIEDEKCTFELSDSAPSTEE